jgi:hypothetical protein
MSNILAVGIDPGVSGAIGWIYSNGIGGAAKTPIIKTQTGAKTRSGNMRKKSQYNEAEMVRILRALKDAAAEANESLRVIIEDVHSMPQDGVAGAFSFGESKGIWRGMLAALDMKYEMVSPSEWRPAMVGRGTDKSMSLVVAQRMFPEAELFQKNDHNKAEALLLAAFLRDRLGLANKGDEQPVQRKRHRVVRQKVEEVT